MKYALLLILFICGCSTHRLVLVYEGGDAAIQGATELVLDTGKEKKK